MPTPQQPPTPPRPLSPTSPTTSTILTAPTVLTAALATTALMTTAPLTPTPRPNTTPAVSTAAVPPPPTNPGTPGATIPTTAMSKTTATATAITVTAAHHSATRRPPTASTTPPTTPRNPSGDISSTQLTTPPSSTIPNATAITSLAAALPATTPEEPTTPAPTRSPVTNPSTKTPAPGTPSPAQPGAGPIPTPHTTRNSQKPERTPNQPSRTPPQNNDKRSWPVRGASGAPRPHVLRNWSPPLTPWAAGHRGVDLAAKPGRPVRAAATGRVTHAGQVAGRGVLTIELSNSGKPPLRTTYEPVRPSVQKGDLVRAGQTIGVLGPKGTSHCSKRCLHWGLLRGDRYLNPLSLLPPHLLRTGRIRLLPLTEPAPSEETPHTSNPTADQPPSPSPSPHGTPDSAPALHTTSREAHSTATTGSNAETEPNAESPFSTSFPTSADTNTEALILAGTLAVGTTWAYSHLRRRTSTAGNHNDIPGVSPASTLTRSPNKPQNQRR